MNTSIFMLIAYDQDKPKTTAAARRMKITKQQYETLANDYMCSLDIGDDTVQIVDRRTLVMKQIDGHLCMIIIDYKIIPDGKRNI